MKIRVKSGHKPSGRLSKNVDLPEQSEPLIYYFEKTHIFSTIGRAFFLDIFMIDSIAGVRTPPSGFFLSR